MEMLAIIVLFCLLFPSIIGRTVADGVHAYEVKLDALRKRRAAKQTAKRDGIATQGKL